MSFLVKAEYHSVVDGPHCVTYLVSFQCLAIVNNATMAMGVQTSRRVLAFSSREYRTQSRVAGAYGYSMFHF